MHDGAPELTARMTCWEAVCILLNIWAASGLDDPSREEDDTFELWRKMERSVRSSLEGLQSQPRLGIRAAELLNNARADGPIAAHAAAWALDRTRFTHFSDPWGAEIVQTLKAGDLFPVTEWNKQLRPLEKSYAHPWQLKVEPGELPHVRRFGSHNDLPPVTFDGSAFYGLSFLNQLATAGAGVINVSLDDFDIPPHGFPITCTNPLQEEVLLTLTSQAVDEGVDVLVFPELAGIDGLAPKLLGPITSSDASPMIAVAGSFHLDDGGTRKNVAELLTPVGRVFTFTKRVPYWGADVREGIDTCTDPLTILVADDVRVLVLICKDMLDDTIVRSAIRYGANLILVPSMSPDLDHHDVESRRLAMRAHALTIVANGPHSNSPHLLIAVPEAAPTSTVRTAASVGLPELLKLEMS